MERPILFSAPMVRSILEGRKTQTRRLVKFRGCDSIEDRGKGPREVPWPWSVELDDWVACPYGQPGDVLWGKETWAPGPGIHTPHDWRDVLWRADSGLVVPPRWHPSIHMPRRISRITLELTSVRVERLCYISRDDAIAEGLESHDDDGVIYWGPLGKGHCDPVGAYRSLWEAINGPGSWYSNPWVWVLGFRRVKP